MLSYMLPAVEEKPLAEIDGIDEEEAGKFERALIKEGIDARKGDASVLGSIGKDASINSFLSDATTATVSHSSMTNTSISDKAKPKFINGGRPQHLKRVSFGSSHGSMVETLIFESPVQEERAQIDQKPNGECTTLPIQEELDQTETEREKVRVKFFQQLKPQEVDLPPNEPDIFEEDYNNLLMAATVAISESNHHFQRLESVESGWENPFRPGGDLSREADEIVELIKGGKPITPTTGEPHHEELDSSLPEAEQNLDQNHLGNNVMGSPEKKEQLLPLEATPKSANGNVSKTDNSPGAVDVKRATVKPDGDASQVEHITIKKKPKCKCCVIQ